MLSSNCLLFVRKCVKYMTWNIFRMAFDFPSGVYFYYLVKEQAFFPLENMINLLIVVNTGAGHERVLSHHPFIEIRNYDIVSCPS